MKVEIDNERLKQLYNLESRCKDMFGNKNPKQHLYVGCHEIESMQNLLKPISNRPTLDELSEVSNDVYSKRHSTCTDWEQARNAGLGVAIIKALDALVEDCQRMETDDDSVVVVKEYRDGYRKDMADG